MRAAAIGSSTSIGLPANASTVSSVSPSASRQRANEGGLPFPVPRPPGHERMSQTGASPYRQVMRSGCRAA